MKNAGLAWIDWLIIAVYASSTIVLGWYYSRKQKDAKDYFVGSGNMSPFLVGVSLLQLTSVQSPTSRCQERPSAKDRSSSC